jgi:predicted Zn-dependent protease
MVDLDRRPTAQQMEELIDAVRRNPAAAFLQLGEAYLALGRPKDVMEVCNVGLAEAPDNIEGRVLLARAHYALHQWKEAQAELLRVVKVDRSNRLGFSLLGEVLLRRGDVERAVPVLQHAQNLDPSSQQILSLLKRARSGEQLDPPPPLPVAVLPRDVAVVQASAPTRMHMLPPEITELPMAIAQQMPAAAPPVRRPPPQQSPIEVPSIEGVRPRIIAQHKPQNAAAAALRQSAAVGENYLNELLTGGLLDVAGVRLPDVQYDLRPDRRWGRSARRTFIFLFLLLFMGLGGGGAWYFWTERQKTVMVARLQRDSKELLVDASYDGITGSLGKLEEALKKDNDNAISMAYAAEAGGLLALLYGTEVRPAERAIKGASQDIKLPTDVGYRELVIGRAATKLAQVADAAAKTTTLYEAIGLLDEYLAKHADDRWARWLKGRAQQLAGERQAAIATIKQAAAGDAGLISAKVDLADLLADDGKLDEAMALYDGVLKEHKDHPLALLGKSLTRAENDVESTSAFDDLKVKLDKPLGPRLLGYRQLALAFANIGLEDYPRAREAAAAATGVSEARFQAKRAWLELQLGNVTEAAKARSAVQWFGKGKAEPDPAAILVDVGLEVAASLGEKALEQAGKLEDLRARRLAAWALIDLNRPREALEEAEKLLAKAPENLEGKALRDYAKVVSGAKDKDAAMAALEKSTRGAKSKVVQHLLGQALVRIGKTKEGQAELARAISDISEEHPNPIVFRTRTELAQLLIADGKLDDASKELDEALKANSGYLPARGTQAQLLLKNGKAEDAYVLLKPIIEESKALSPALLLAWAEALASHKNASAKDKEQAAQVIQQLKADGAPLSVDEMKRVAALVDPKLAEAMGGTPPKKKAPPKKAPPKKRGRR